MSSDWTRYGLSPEFVCQDLFKTPINPHAFRRTVRDTQWTSPGWCVAEYVLCLPRLCDVATRQTVGAAIGQRKKMTEKNVRCRETVWLYYVE